MLSQVESTRPFSIGHYDVVEQIGRGGMGVVYWARSRRDGGDYAVKTIRDFTAGHLAALRSEVAALRLVEHPGVVRVFDDGLAEARPWYAMELVRGRSLAAYVRRMHPEVDGTSSASFVTERVLPLAAALQAPALAVAVPPKRAWSDAQLRDLLQVYRELASILGHLHRHGIVHRDVKPSNVVLNERLELKLLDFGLASRFDGPLRHSKLWLNAPARLAGTLPYLSPEAILGYGLDSRADLYALGCMLYESLAGRPPFSGQCGDVLGEHLHTSAIPPSRLVDGLSDGLDALVLGLLAKDRGDRIAYAEDVVTRIEAIVGARPTRTSQVSSAHLLKPPLVGRGAVREELGEHARRALGGTGKVLALRGESGIGKSFLLSEFALDAITVGFSVIAGGAPAPAAPGLDAEVQNAPLAALRCLLEALADRCRSLTVATCSPLRNDDFLLLARYEPALSLVPGFDALPVSSLPSDAFGDERVLEAVQRGVEFLALGRPLLLLLDDLQWADRLTLGFLDVLEELVTKRPILAVCARRREPGSEQGSEAVPGRRVLELSRLDDGEVRELAAGMLGVRELPSALADALLDHSAGSPLFVAEYLRSAVAAGMLERRGGKWQFSEASPRTGLDELPLSPALGDLFAARISALSEHARAVLALAAVIGRDAEPELLQQLLPRVNVFPALAELRGHAVLDERPGERLRFLHDRLREKIYDELEPSERVAMHRGVARALELQTAWSERRAALLPRIANHWLAAREPALAAAAFKDAGDYARASGAHADAVRYIEAAIASLERAVEKSDARLAELEEASGDLWLIQAEGRRAEERFLRAERRSSDPLTNARLRRKLAGTYTVRQNPQRATALLEQAEGLLERVADRVLARIEWIDSRVERAWTLYWPGRASELAELIRDTEPVVREHGTPAQRARLQHCGILSDLRSSRYRIDDDALEKGRAAVSAAELGWNPMETLSIRFTIGFMLVLGGFGAEALVPLQQALRGAEELADRARLIRTKAYISLAHRFNGDEEAARLAALATLEIAQTHTKPFSFYKGLALANLGWVWARLGDFERAEEHFAEALSLWLAPTPAYPFTGVGAWPQLLIAARRGDLPAARSAAAILARPDQQYLAPDLQRALLALASPSCDANGLARVLELAQRNDVPGARGLGIDYQSLNERQFDADRI
jgi:serine/threonine protein kinase/tetratricopeptide (TPR) repeat protein